MYKCRIGLTVLILVAIASHSTVQAQPARDLIGKNLIVNGNAEMGPGVPNELSVVKVPGWTVTIGNFTAVMYGASGGFPGITSLGPQNRGSNFFAGGPSNSLSSAFQEIDVSRLANEVDTGQLRYSLSAYLGGYSTQDDNAVVQVDYLDKDGEILGEATIEPVLASERNSITGSVQKVSSGLVPKGARKVKVKLQMTRILGSYNDGSVDNLSLIFSR